VVLQDTTAERGMGKTHEDHFARLNEPKFIPPPPEDLPPGTPDGSFPFYGPPSTQQFRIVDTYIDPDYKHPPPWYPYPDSVPGLPERSQPLLLYLISKSRKIKHDPLAYFNKIVNGSSENYKVRDFLLCYKFGNLYISDNHILFIQVIQKAINNLTIFAFF